MKNTAAEREILKSHVFDYDEKALSGIGTGVPQPAVQEPYPDGATLIELPEVGAQTAPTTSFYECSLRRCSRRYYTDDPLTLKELAFLLWSTQGVKKVIWAFGGRGVLPLRPAPSVTNPFESYVAALNVESLDRGLYRYLPLVHKLLLIRKDDSLAEGVADTFNNPMQNQDYTKRAGAVIYWSCLPHRAEWRNKDTYAKLVLLDMGHISQNFYLAVEAMGCGGVVIAGYMQKKADNLLGIGGDREFVVHCAAAGHIDENSIDVYSRLPDLRYAPENGSTEPK